MGWIWKWGSAYVEQAQPNIYVGQALEGTRKEQAQQNVYVEQVLEGALEEQGQQNIYVGQALEGALKKRVQQSGFEKPTPDSGQGLEPALDSGQEPALEWALYRGWGQSAVFSFSSSSFD